MNVGDYVRTKTGIHKIFRINEKADIWKYHCDKKPTGEWDSSYEYIKVRKDDIIKSSPNIIDLIEVGDYVNGEKVKALKGDIENHKINNEDDVIYTEYINDYDEWCGFEKDEIKSIVTKQCFESMEYKVGD